ncbi:hypothetical protein [Chondrinema litorale]|uniref:hypothetical protein n=1 Tax=Chondrinema litorale TaxID=2994555 RepID=UPI00254271CA|nr:hypothetical protein [Chondrinema litorale]UZR94318.1 hypothetical protein OQ292_00615 [Chondrinema litorale]
MKNRQILIKLSCNFLVLFFISSCTLDKPKDDSVDTQLTEKENMNELKTKFVSVNNLSEDTSSFKEIVPKLSGKDIAWYLENDSLAANALQYYIGKKDAAPDSTFFKIFKSLPKKDALNPLYIHLLNKAVLSADGMLAEELGDVVMEFVEKNPDAFTQMLLDSAYAGRKEIARNYAFLLAHEIQQEEATAKKEEKFVIRTMLSCAECSDEKKAVLEYFFNMVNEMKD